MKRRLPALLCALALLLSLCACWADEPAIEEDDFWQPGLTQADEADEPAAVPITSLALPILQGASLDPITCPDGMQQVLVSLLYEALFALDDSFTPQPVLCSDYEVNDTATRFTFFLRSGVTFSDGSALSAGDVLSTLRRAAQSVRYGARFANVTSMRTVSGALVITLSRPNRSFPALLDIPIVKSGSEKSAVPVGTGPYLYMTDGTAAFLQRSDEWWQQRSLPLDRIDLRTVKDGDTASYLFSSREVHLLSSDLTSGASLPDADAQITDYPSANLLYLSFNTRKSLLADASLRSALSAAIDRETIASGYLAGHADAARFPISPRAACCPDDLSVSLPAPDLAAALADAGITESRPRTLTLLVNEGDSFKRSIADYLARAFTSGPLTVVVQALPWADYLDALSRGTWDLCLAEVRLTADWDISALVRADGALNYGAYLDPQCDTLLDAFLADGTEASAAALCRHLAESAPFAPIAFKASSLLTPDGLCEQMTPSPSSVFYRFELWQLHLSPEA